MKITILAALLAATLGLGACNAIPRSQSAIANDCGNLYKGDQKAIDKCLADRRALPSYMGR